jgi:hypothetical protein
MKLAMAFLFLLVSATVICAQSTDPSKWMCRNLSESGGFLYQGETIFGSQACRPIEQTSPSVPRRESGTTVPAPGPAPVPAPVYAGPITTKVEPGSTVFIAPMNGFETYLAAAMTKKKVQMALVASEAQADFVLTGTSEEKKAGWAKMAFTGNIHSDDAASVTMTNRKSGAIAFAYAVNKKNTLHGEQTSAEACAKHLQDHIEGKE